MLTSNHLLTSEQETMLREWVDIISDALFWLLDGVIDEAFTGYNEHFEKYK